METHPEPRIDVDLGPLRRLRARALAAGAGETLGTGAAVSFGVMVALALADAAAGLPPWLLAAGLAAAIVPIAWGAAAFARFVRRGDWSIEGAARLAAARSAGSPNALSSWLEARGSGAIPPYVADRLAAAASREAAALDPSVLAPLRRAVRASAAAGLLVAAWAAGLAAGYDPVARLFPAGADTPVATPDGGRSTTEDGPDRVAVVVTPPAYTGRPPSRVEDPVEVAAPAGATVEVELRPGAPNVRAELSVSGGDRIAMQPGAGGALVASFKATAEGSVAVYPAGDAGERPALLLPLRVVPDRAPDVRIVQPKADVLVEAAARPKGLVVEFEASDDYGLGSARLEYIRSVGEGDAAEFTRGQLPAAIAGSRDGRSVGRITIDFDRLGLTPGSALVYHIAVEDRNTVTGPSTGLSESLVFEVAAVKPPASITLDDLRPEDMQRFLLSQRMILENTIKLEAQRAKLPREQFLARSTEIAADQRAFKESFSQFIEIHETDDHRHDAGSGAGVSGFEQGRQAAEDADHEMEHASGGADPVEEGREANERAAEAETTQHQHGAPETEAPVSGTARELMLAIRAMWDAEGSLGIGETDKAIPSERLALDHLKRAQRAVRYHPRVTVKTKPIDLKRRYAGELAEIRARVERLGRREPAPGEAALREALGRLAAALDRSVRLDPNAADARLAEGAARLATESSETATALLGAETGYQPEVVAVASRLSAVAANARRLAEAARAGDAPRARSAWTAVNDELTGAVSRLGALLDARPVARGGGGVTATGARRRAADYFRNLAGGGR